MMGPFSSFVFSAWDWEYVPERYFLHLFRCVSWESVPGPVIINMYENAPSIGMDNLIGRIYKGTMKSSYYMILYFKSDKISFFCLLEWKASKDFNAFLPPGPDLIRLQCLMGDGWERRCTSMEYLARTEFRHCLNTFCPSNHFKSKI